MKLMLHFFNPKKKEKELNVAFQNRPIKGFIKSVFFFFFKFFICEIGVQQKYNYAKNVSMIN